MRFLPALILLIASPFALAQAPAKPAAAKPATPPAAKPAAAPSPHVVLHTTLGDITLELYPADAPTSGVNFLA